MGNITHYGLFGGQGWVRPQTTWTHRAQVDTTGPGPGKNYRTGEMSMQTTIESPIPCINNSCDDFDTSFIMYAHQPGTLHVKPGQMLLIKLSADLSQADEACCFEDIELDVSIEQLEWGFSYNDGPGLTYRAPGLDNIPRGRPNWPKDIFDAGLDNIIEYHENNLENYEP